MAEANPDQLKLEEISSGYGGKQVLWGINLAVRHGEIVAMIGHNGAGKSTLLKTIFGMIPLWEGRVFFQGNAIPRPSPRQWLKAGVVYLPQGNRVFSDLTVRENLEVAGATLERRTDRRCAVEKALDGMPTLQERQRQKAGTLSGGEQQLLALAMSSVSQPRLLLLDEPSLGLAPRLVTETLSRIQRLNCEAGVSVLIVEQKVHAVLRIAHRVYNLRNGRVSFNGPADELKDQGKLKAVYL